MNVDRYQLYVLLSGFANTELRNQICQQLRCLEGHRETLEQNWKQIIQLAREIASSSDRVNLQTRADIQPDICKHPLSGAEQTINANISSDIFDCSIIAQETDIKKVYWWFWRFYPEILANTQPNALLTPAHPILPDCPEPSYRSTIAALLGAMYPPGEDLNQPEHPYLLIFTFSPVQEIIKASRKFLDFWSGSYLLHYLSAKLCWYIARKYSPDAVITPSLWSQEIIDALIVQEFDDNNSTIFRDTFQQYSHDNCDPVERFQQQKSTNLVTAGFPNVITALVPGKEAAINLGKELTSKLKQEWSNIAIKVREDIKAKVQDAVTNDGDLWEAILEEFSHTHRSFYVEELQKLQQGGCWEWNKVWDAQIKNTWQCYWSAIPLGNPDLTLSISTTDLPDNYQEWKKNQNQIAPPRFDQTIPTVVEETAYSLVNIGTWWGSLQARLGQSIQAVKNTRTWQIPAAPGERSTISGQFSTVHPNLHYHESFKEGGGLPESSLRLFWRVMAIVYPGLFNGSEKLNALELTKRMAWEYGGVAESLGIDLTGEENDPGSSEEEDLEEENDRENSSGVDYEKLIRFPNLSSIAAAKFAYEHPQKMCQYWSRLYQLINSTKVDSGERIFSRQLRKKFWSKTRRDFQVPKTDKEIKKQFANQDYRYNGVMFSSKWLADDLSLNQNQSESNDNLQKLREIVNQAHKDCGFNNGSPADWWVIVLADGDSMGKYVSGSKMKEYSQYLVLDAVDEATRNSANFEELLNTKKRMGPATHVGLNRALLDFSNRLVPYLTEKRFCGRVVYSGGDDVMVVLPLADLPEFLLSLRAAWCGGNDPQNEFTSEGGYWHPNSQLEGLPSRPHFTMGEGATMSMGIVIAHKSVPLPTVLENLWEAEKERAKKLAGKDGLCFRVIYGGGNTLEALMKGDLLDSWWNFLQNYSQVDFSPLLYRLAEELPRHAAVTKSDNLLEKATEVILSRREQTLSDATKNALLDWINSWEAWAYQTQQKLGKDALGIQEKDLAYLLRFSAFWVDKMMQFHEWTSE
ncbi:MAG: type III-B CRISPR-associated protein Cas10/Cmr2 [Oscillatoria sp. PMC 1051.18]|nr:type III-B CRISPR-associated protein Cas10/Cmr2 [Oscillatoria sp. PMC 1050.18]MEC5032752.1 type III-B CRISPR-associated protein Cas10/Cmr2 [Oscillatoria sp. PMC 1051.18]